MTIRKVLALDVATSTGWCFGATSENMPHYGSIRFAEPGATLGQIMAGGLGWFVDFVKVNQPDLIVCEASNAHHMAGKTTLKTIQVLIGLPAMFEGLAWRLGIKDVREVTTKECRDYFIGSNPRRDVAKPMVIAKCRALGYEPQDDDAADAISLWEYQRHLLNRRAAS